MTVDLEDIRYRRERGTTPRGEDVDFLLAELAQVRRDLNTTGYLAAERLTRALQAEERLERVSGWYNAEDRKTKELQARLGKVRALLVQTLRDVRGQLSLGSAGDYGRSIIDAALYEWEREERKAT